MFEEVGDEPKSFDSIPLKITIGVILILLAIVAGTYAFAEMSQEKLAKPTVETIDDQITLHASFDPHSTNSRNWKIDVNPELSKEVYVDAGENSKPANVRISIWELIRFDTSSPEVEIHSDDDAENTGYQVYNKSASSDKFREYIEFVMPNVIPFSEYSNEDDVWIWDDVTNDGLDGWFYWANPTVADEQTTDLLESMVLLKQPSHSFAYSQYVSMQVINSAELIWQELGEAPEIAGNPTLTEILYGKRTR